ncbi:methionine--tRNA ligase [Synechococcus sp. PCC 7336]|uniref:methionine--tRNA ligase n=1 Tax=Synechococcus sp. PCC 7336 TaxID=195250 RepID=UPI0003462E50|nr:methionine--tRNA ligase [Synechococcus sp. PCC 7336]
MPRFAVTTPLYYVNGLPHLGSAYTTIAADAIARYRRLRGDEVLLITGTDEHGQKIQRTAEARNIPAQQHCDEIAAEFDRLWHLLEIRYDRFSRTTSPRHSQIVREFFQRVWDRGDIYLGHQQGWYCVGCETFYDESELLEDHICSIHHKPTEWRDEPNYFFRLSHYQEKLETLYAERPEFIQPDFRRNEVLNFVKQGLKDFSISRAHVTWGIPLPNDPDQTLYVWFDALLGYITALLEADETASLDNALRKWWPINLHLIGKDILRFHAVYWPAMQMSAGIPVSQQVFGHGFLTKDGRKMGKSLGNVLDPYDLVEQYGTDAVRYYFLKEIELGQDGDFSQTRFVDIVNADLAKNLGNLLNRSLSMLQKYCEYTIPELEIAADHPLRAIAEALPEQVAEAYDRYHFKQAGSLVLTLSQASNKFLETEAPWTLYKQGNRAAVERVLYSVLESVRIAAILLSPIVPDLSLRILVQLGYTLDSIDRLDWAMVTWGGLSAKVLKHSPKPVFQQLS